jgi:hypothetical protein
MITGVTDGLAKWYTSALMLSMDLLSLKLLDFNGWLGI